MSTRSPIRRTHGFDVARAVRGGARHALPVLLAASLVGVAHDSLGSDDRVQAKVVQFTIDARRRHSISPFIYGMNFVERGGSPAGASPWNGATVPAGVTLNRFGGNRLTAFNWETGWSNAGSDAAFANDARLVRDGASYDYGDEIGSAVSGRVDASFARNQGIVLTIPIIGYVAGNALGVPLATTSADRAARLAEHFKVSRVFKGAPLSLAPSTTDGVVNQDEFVNWVKARWPNHSADRTRPIFFQLDNEPDLWSSTHATIQSDSSDDPARPRLLTYAQLADANVLHARAVKSVLPDATVFGPSLATFAGILSGGRYTNRWHDDPDYGRRNFVDVYLERMRRAESVHGRRLLDVLDVHYYPESGDGRGTVASDRATQTDSMIAARLQAPRSLWDSSYVEGSWVNQAAGGPIALIPRLRAQIAARYPGTRLSITEYFFGRAGDISGGLAQADALGIFGREGVFAANLWPQANVSAAPYGGDGAKAYAYAFGAFRLFLDVDGAGTRFGDTGLHATTSDVAGSSVYASLDARGRIVIVAINKQRTAAAASFTLRGAPAVGRVTSVRRIMDGVPAPAEVAPTDVSLRGGNTLTYEMPPMSASTIVLAP